MKFTVFEETRKDVGAHRKPGFYFHATSGSDINLPSQRYDSLSAAFRGTEQLMYSVAKAQNHPDAKFDRATFLQLHPISYTRKSLKKPTRRVAAKKQKAVITKRTPALAKARIGRGVPPAGEVF